MSPCPKCGQPHPPTVTCDTLVPEHKTRPPEAVEPEAEPALTGTTLGNYKLHGVLGEGSFARVYLAEHQILGKRCALKLLHNALLHDEDVVRRFVGEARATAGVHHEHVVQVFDIGSHDGRPFMVMELLEGQTLEQLAVHAPLPFARVAPLAIQLCDALQAVHASGVVHRDLKPANLFVEQRGGRDFVKVVDFGIARREQLSLGESRTAFGSVMGTPHYMAPEQCRGLEVDARCDVYALGVVLYLLATGKLPFEGSTMELMLAHATKPPPSPRALNPNVDPRYEIVLLKALAKDPALRYPSMDELGKAIAALHYPQSPALPDIDPAMERTQPGRREPRMPVHLSVEVQLAGRPSQILRASSVSRGGLFVECDGELPPPYLGATVRPLVSGGVPVAGKVVRVVSREEAQARGGLAGFAIEFETAGARSPGMDALLRAGISADGARAALERIEAEPDEPYKVLGLPEHADASMVRDAGTRLPALLDPEALQAVAPELVPRVRAARERVREAAELLVDPARRAAFDAERGNFQGVARALEAGLAPTAAERLREAFLNARPTLSMVLTPVMRQLDDAEKQGAAERVQQALGIALRLDPLNLALQRRYWSQPRPAQNEAK